MANFYIVHMSMLSYHTFWSFLTAQDTLRHDEILKNYQSNGKAHAQVPQNFKVLGSGGCTQAASMVGCPESPVWLDMVHRPDEAEKVREQLQGPATAQQPASHDLQPPNGLEEPLISSDDLPEVGHRPFAIQCKP